ncbi:23S rRNA (pseudouridine(1915)-N(3))-methyltransferase RlmH [Cellulosilyticum sp. I15G10I2]|uniref:23S rRNA (pseudouridine(1915)-N(3))-methyltransferase RlmH n=1 Tax=Cellulosilyticum sp. I15G10I2 TaxID=1892843 RepID=UPI00085BFC9C|nr:23S rRNA (pseudouridine(1915)-N(3))-methyltransferase RlmH [Cellulosilyticum sp. I15G10I2]
MKIDIICVGKLKEKYLAAAVSEYVKRLSKYCKLDIKEVPDEKAPERLSEKQELEIKNKEGEAILKHVKEGAYVIALAIEGKMYSSEGLADQIADLGVRGKSHIVFIIGGSLGLSDGVLKRADEKISFSKMTFPHQLVRVILLEQIYRCFRINNGEPYHK